VVCTRNRSQSLRRALEKWSEVNPEGLLELIVIDNGSTDDTQDVIASFFQAMPFRIYSFVQMKPGVSAARNLGAEKANGTLIAFTDDDCYPSRNYPMKIIESFNDDAGIAFIGGRVLLYDKEDLAITIQTSREAKEFNAYEVFKAGAIHGANFVINRNILRNDLVFDEDLGPGKKISAAEDTEYIFRILWSGFRGKYDPNVVVYHHHGRKELSEKIKLYRSYAIGRGAYYCKAILSPKSRKVYLNFWLSEFSRDLDKQRFLEVWGALMYIKLLLIKSIKNYLDSS